MGECNQRHHEGWYCAREVNHAGLHSYAPPLLIAQQTIATRLRAIQAMTSVREREAALEALCVELEGGA